METEIPYVVPSTPAVVEKVIPIPCLRDGKELTVQEYLGTIMLINMDYDKNARKSYNAKTTITILFSFISYP
jgi:hypothetical protein